MAGEPHDLDLGTAGAGARRELEKRKLKREAQTREAHPHIGGLLLRFQDPPQSEKAWESGAIGEEMLAAHLARRCPEVVVLHDRRMPESRANIDHIAIGPCGVFVIDAKRYKGKIEVRAASSGDPVLMIGGRRKTKLVEGLKRQVHAVEKGLAIIEQDVAVKGCFCFIRPEGKMRADGLPFFDTLTVDGLPLYTAGSLSKRLNRSGPLSREQIAVLAEALAELFHANRPTVGSPKSEFSSST